MSVEIENREAEPTLECAPEPQAAPEEDRWVSSYMYMYMYFLKEFGNRLVHYDSCSRFYSDTISKQIHHSSGQDVASNSESVTKQGVYNDNFPSVYVNSFVHQLQCYTTVYNV